MNSSLGSSHWYLECTSSLSLSKPLYLFRPRQQEMGRAATGTCTNSSSGLNGGIYEKGPIATYNSNFSKEG